MKRQSVFFARLAALCLVSCLAAQRAEAAGIRFNNPFSSLSRAPFQQNAAPQRLSAPAVEASISAGDYDAPIPKARPKNLMIAVAAPSAIMVEPTPALAAATPPPAAEPAEKIVARSEPAPASMPALPKATSKQDALDAKIMSTVTLGRAEVGDVKAAEKPATPAPVKTAAQGSDSVMFSSKPNAAALIGQSGASVLTPPNMSGALAAFVNGPSKSVATNN